jgi:hypothetical protein
MNPGAKGGTFFRTMVLMGSSVAMSCGGMTQGDGSGGSSSSGAGPNGTGSGGAGSGGAGSGGAGSGGLPVGAGGAIIIDPGTGGEGYYAWGGAFPTDCPTTQLACVGSKGCSQYDYGYLTVPGSCVCDSERPESAEDCAEGEGFTCLVGSEDAYGRRIDPPIAYNCECVVEDADWNGYCFGFCDAHSDSYGSSNCTEPGETQEDLQAYLCGCAVTILK